jgi:hypothetical protein
MKKILIATYLERHLQKMLPIIHNLEKRNEIDLRVMLLTSQEWQLADREGIRYSKFDDYTEKKRRVDFDLEWGLEPLINAIDREHPDLFLAIEVNYILRNAVRYCKKLAIKSLIVQHGTPNQYSLHAFAPFEADCFAAWGDFTRDYLIKNGVDSERIVVTGGPVYDKYLSVKPEKARIYHDLGISPDIQKLIVFTLQGQGAGGRPSIEEIESGIAETLKAAASYPGLLLLFQIHPQQTIAEVQKLASGALPLKANIIRYPDTESLISISDGVITFFSTTAIDALVLDKPLLLINLMDDRDFFPFVPMHAAFGAYTREEIPLGFKNLVENPAELKSGRDEAVEYVIYKKDGQSMARVMALIDKMLGGLGDETCENRR